MDTSIEERTQDAINSMDQGDTMILTVKAVKSGKIQLEFAEIIPTPVGTSNNALGAFNKSDERFSSRGARRDWLSAEPADAKRLLPEIAEQVDEVVAQGEGAMAFVGLKNPTVNGTRLRVQITETHTPRSDWEEENLDRAAKQDGNGNYLLKGGKLIFSQTATVFGEANHTFIQHDSVTTDPYSADYVAPEDMPQRSIAQEEREQEQATAEVEA